MKYFKMLCLILTSLNSFSYNILSKEEEQFALKYYTQEEIEKNDEWIFHPMYTNKKVQYNPPEFKMPHFKFYKNEKLTGKPYAHIDEKGLSINGKYECTNAYKEKNFLFLVIEKGDEENVTREGNYNLYEFDVKGCPHFPLQTWGSMGNETRTIISRFTVINEKIGKFKMQDQDVYFDASEWIEKDLVEKNTKVILKNILTTKDLEDIGDLILGLRTVLEKGSMQDVYSYILKSNPKAGTRTVFVSLETKHAINKTLNHSERDRAIKSTVLTTRKVSVRDAPFLPKTGAKDIDVFFGRGGGNVSLYLGRENNIWSISYFDIFGKDTDASGN